MAHDVIKKIYDLWYKHGGAAYARADQSLLPIDDVRLAAWVFKPALFGNSREDPLGQRGFQAFKVKNAAGRQFGFWLPVYDNDTPYMLPKNGTYQDGMVYVDADCTCPMCGK